MQIKVYYVRHSFGLDAKHFAKLAEVIAQEVVTFSCYSSCDLQIQPFHRQSKFVQNFQNS